MRFDAEPTPLPMSWEPAQTLSATTLADCANTITVEPADWSYGLTQSPAEQAKPTPRPTYWDAPKCQWTKEQGLEFIRSFPVPQSPAEAARDMVDEHARRSSLRDWESGHPDRKQADPGDEQPDFENGPNRGQI